MTSISFIDSLTGCLNAGAIQSMRPGSAIAAIDIIGFRTEINDRYGHAAGDRVLRVIGARLRDGLAPRRIYRSGGDEFLVEIDEPLDRRDAELLARRVIDLVAAPIDGIDQPIVVDVGVSLRRIDHDVMAVRLRAERAQWQARTQEIPFVVEEIAGEGRADAKGSRGTD